MLRPATITVATTSWMPSRTTWPSIPSSAPPSSSCTTTPRLTIAGGLLSVFPGPRPGETYTEQLINGELDVKSAVENLAKEINEAIEIYNLTN